MRNYFFSIAVHVILLLILLGFSSVTIKNQPLEVRQAIMVEFNHSEVQEPRVQETKKSEVQPVKPKQVVKSTPPNATKLKAVKVEPKKTIEKTTLHTSQKPRAEVSKVLQDESPIVKKVIPPLTPAPTQEEIAEAERQKNKEQKRAQFESLLAKANNKTAADQNQLEKREEVSDSNVGTSSNISDTNKNIQGVLGNRKVLRVPTIKDTSQKKGRVVVKICVDQNGQVTSSKYTMMGSTTNDSYLIKLAEEGAMKYLFSTSSNPKECGNVIIDFQLK